MSETRQCCARVYHAGIWGGSQCSRKAVVEEGGKFYCRQHAPSAEQARREKWRAEYDRRWARTKAAHSVQERERGVVAAAEAAADQRGSWDAVADAVAALRAACATLAEMDRNA